MIYMGSKINYADALIGVMQADTRPQDQWYVEPFVGGANVIDKVKGLRLGADSHIYLIELMQALQRGWTPPIYVSETEYVAVRDNPMAYPRPLVAFVGFCCSYGGRWFQGYARSRQMPDGKMRNYPWERRAALMAQVPRLKGIDFMVHDYHDLTIPPYSLIYCDPPYAGAQKYHHRFGSERFWNRVRQWFEQGHKVYVSEYEAPSDFTCVWERKVKCCMSLGKAGQAVERLFTK